MTPAAGKAILPLKGVKPMKFLWVTIHVTDMGKSLKFYQEVVGLKLNRRVSPVPGRELAFLGEGDTQVELIWDQDKKPEAQSSSLSLGFQVASLRAFQEKLQVLSLPVHSGPFQPVPHLTYLYVLDPDGVKVQFVEMNNPE